MAVEVKNLQSAADIDRETLAVLGAPTAYRLPPVTQGRMALLDLLDSPLLNGGVPSKRDIWIAAYVIAYGRDAMGPVNKAMRQIEALERAEVEHGAEYLAALRSAAGDLEVFDASLMEFIENTGLMPGDMAAQIRAGIETHLAAFSMIPGTGTDSKKNAAGVTLTGSLQSLPGQQKSARHSLGTRFYGTCRLLWSRICTWSKPAGTLKM